MKKITILFLCFCFFSCKNREQREEKVRILTPEQAKQEAIQNKIIEGQEFVDNCGVQEFEYKGHTYMYNTVKDGICAWHAGHCKCNSKKL